MKLTLFGLLTAGLIALGTGAFAQPDLEKADRYYRDLKFNFAIPHYLRALDKKADPQATERLADCFRLISDYRNSELWYHKALELNPSKPLLIYRYAEALRSNAKYKEAEEQLRKYRSLVPSDTLNVENLIKSCRLSREWMLRPEPVDVSNETGLNTPYSEFSPVRFRNGLLFTSDRQGTGAKKKNKEEDREIYGWTGAYYLKLFYAEYAEEKWKQPAFLDKEINEGFHNGPAAYDPARGLLCFTKTTKGKKLRNVSPLHLRNLVEPLGRKQLFFSGEKDGKWQKPYPFRYNNPAQYSVQHPSFSPDGRRLYFSSDMPGGFGKFDLYVCESLGDTSWSTPVNLGEKINSPGDEGFPFVSADGTLYFSSSGHAGMGGLDIFRAKGSGKTWEEPVNMRYPFNSSRDDFGILFSDSSKGFLSSNREGGIGADDIFRYAVRAQECTLTVTVMDAELSLPLNVARLNVTGKNGSVYEAEAGEKGKYEFRIKDCGEVKVSAFVPGYVAEFRTVSFSGNSGSRDLSFGLKKGITLLLEGTVMDKASRKPLEGVTVAVFETSTGDADRMVTKADGKYAFPLKPGQPYRVVAQKEGFFPDKSVFDTRSVKKGAPVSVNLFLDRVEMDKVFVVREIYWDRNKAEIRKDALGPLNDLVSFMKNNPGVKVEIGSHTDSRARESYNLELSEKRAQAVAGYLISKGIEKGRLAARGYGEMQLLNRCSSFVECSEEEHQQNRRTEFRIIGK
jgi:outer membrane protein OmpA-like peptidoglycan-associated protein